MKNCLILIGISTLLVGCSYTPTTKAAKELCTGTKRPYKISGKTYQPQDHYDYDEKGIASWYGPGFDKRPTSCGSIYDMNSLTAAHKTLPIPSVVEVTNLDNGKNLTLVVNDRGPFVGDRIIDLSKRAAQELGTHGKGLGRVRVKALPVESMALASHLKQYGRYGKHPQGRKWDDIYFQEIAGTEPMTNRPTVINAVMRDDDDYKPVITNTVRRSDRRQPMPQQLNYIIEEEVIFEELIESAEKYVSKKNQAKQTKSKSPQNIKTSGARLVRTGGDAKKNIARKPKKRVEQPGKSAILQNKKGGTMYSIKLAPYAKQQAAKQKLNLVEREGRRGAQLIAN